MKQPPPFADSAVSALSDVAARMADMVELQSAAFTLALTAKAAPIAVTVTLPNIPAPVVHVACAPVVVNLPEQAAPVVHVTNEVQPAAVSVDVTARIPPRQTVTDIERDAHGEIKRVAQTETDLPSDGAQAADPPEIGK